MQRQEASKIFRLAFGFVATFFVCGEAQGEVRGKIRLASSDNGSSNILTDQAKHLTTELIKIRWARNLRILTGCDGTYYVPSQKTICLNNGLVNKVMSGAGNGAVKFVFLHELAHYYQDFHALLDNKSITSIELQADCMSGYFLGYGLRIAASRVMLADPDSSMERQSIEAIKGAQQFGDFGYDSPEHHGTPEMRMLAARSGLRYGLSGKTAKDNYYNLYCNLPSNL